MKDIILSGSLAYDRIMNFPESFSDHILPDKIHNLNVCFQVDGISENFGGTAGNIAYALKLMGGSPLISATIGSDHHNYFYWLGNNNIPRDGIKIIPDELTASAYITTDKNNNQITGFNPGAMKYSSKLDIESLDTEKTLVLVSPGNLDDMIDYPRRCKKCGIDYIFDPGQALPVLQGDDLVEVISDCMILIVNDYEFSLIMEKTSLNKNKLLKLAKTTIVTLGDKGSTIYDSTGKTDIPAMETDRVIDPTGAGDAYRGGLLYGLLSAKDMKTCGLLGSVCASFAVESNGTQVYTFTPDQFKKRLAEI